MKCSLHVKLAQCTTISQTTHQKLKLKGEAIRLLPTNPSETTVKESLSNFKTRLGTRGYPKQVMERRLFAAGRQYALQQKKKTCVKVVLFVITYHPGLSDLEQIEFNPKLATAENII